MSRYARIRAGAMLGGVAALLVTGCAAEQTPGLKPLPESAVTEPCPADLTATGLTRPVDLGAADVDGDGTDDSVVMGSVPGGGRGCAVAVVVTTADDTSAAPVEGASEPVGGTTLGPPVFAQVDGAAGDEIVVTTSWNPRGGGGIGMFSWVDGGLVQVQSERGPWTLAATVDDGGGTPQLLSCIEGGFEHVTAYPPGLDTGSTVTTYELEAGAVTVRERAVDRAATYEQVETQYPGMPRAGLAVLPDCQ